MYKSKLQEMCHKQKWAMPKYTCMRDGPDHCPQFKASVMVSGLNFDNPTISKTSKQAFNEAAKVAFLHFSNSDNRNEHVEQTNSNKEEQKPQIQDMDVKYDFPAEFKKKLEMYVKKKNLDSPAYHSEKESSNAPCFRGMVSIGEDWFESQELYETVEEADDGAAQTALLALTTDALLENDPNSYKNMLRELAEEEGFFLPKYTTVRSGGDRCKMFSSVVEVGEELFEGVPAESKKRAELNAAKAAYTVFMERKLFQPGSFSPGSTDDDISKLAPRMDSLTISEDYHGNPTSHLTSTIKTEQAIGKNDAISSSHIMTKCETTMSDEVDGPSVRERSEMKSYLLCNRVKVFTCIPDVVLPKGTVVLPISENKWTTVCLEFPNEKRM